jgi:hypothetical protein
MMTNSGFSDGMAFGGDWFMAWVYVGILGVFVFLGKVILKDNMDMDFNLTGALIGVLTTIVIITLTGWSKVAFLIGLVILVAGGFFLDQLPWFGGGG